MTGIMTNLDNSVNSLFDPSQPGGYFGNPGFTGLLGLLSGLGATSGASRLPITNGQVFGSMAGGLLQGGQDAYRNRLIQAEGAGANINDISALTKVNLFRQFVEGKPPLSMGDVGGADYEESAKNYKAAQANGSQPTGGGRPTEEQDRRNGSAPGAAPGTSGAVASPGTDTSQPGWYLRRGATTQSSAPAANAVTPSIPGSLAPGLGASPNPIIARGLMGQMLGFKSTPYDDAVLSAQFYPPGSPQRVGAERFAAKQSGINPSPDLRAGGTQLLWDQNMNGGQGGFRAVFKNPNLPEGYTTEEDGNGNMRAVPVPGALQGIGAVEGTKAGAKAAAEYPYEIGKIGATGAQARQTAKFNATIDPFTTYDESGNPIIRPRIDLLPSPATPREGLTFGSLSPSPRFGFGYNAEPATAAPSVHASADTGSTAPANVTPPVTPNAGTNTTAQPSAAAPKTPVQFKAPPIPTRLGDFMKELGPDYEVPGIPKAPPGSFLGPPSEARKEAIKEDSERLAGYQREAAGGQKIYTNLEQLYQIMARGQNTGPIAPAANDLTALARQMGMSNLIPKGFDPNSAAAFNKLSTDMVFGALKQLAGAPRVAEIEGLQKANPNLTMPPAANVELLNNALAEQRWKDARSRLATQWQLKFPGTLGEFDAQFNEKYPQVDLYNSITQQAEKAGWKIPGDEGALEGAKGGKHQIVVGTTATGKDGSKKRWNGTEWQDVK